MSLAPLRSLRRALLPAVLTLGLAGCLPRCQRQADKRLMPQDSTARALAATVPGDTLALLWAAGPAETRRTDLAFPRTVRFSATGDTLWTADAQANRLLAFGRDGRPLATVGGAFAMPFLAGRFGDTLVVFSAGANRFDLVLPDTAGGGRIVRQVSVPGLPEERSLVRYGHAFAGGFAVKAGGRKTPPFLLVLGPDGRVRRRSDLAGPLWNHAGLLRTPGGDGRADTLYSLVGFAPVVHRYTGPPEALRSFSVPLVGFDSPKLDQRRRYLLGESDAPLLTASAASLPGGRLFVSNIRPGWLLVDVYDRGRLAARLLDRREALDLDFLVEDLDVRQDSAGTLVATAQAKPSPRIALYRWAR